MSFRINYGNGQVSGTFGSLSEAKRGLLAVIEIGGKIGGNLRGVRIQQYLGCGEWGGVQ